MTPELYSLAVRRRGPSQHGLSSADIKCGLQSVPLVEVVWRINVMLQFSDLLTEFLMYM